MAPLGSFEMVRIHSVTQEHMCPDRSHKTVKLYMIDQSNIHSQLKIVIDLESFLHYKVIIMTVTIS